MKNIRIGVIAIQGNVSEHVDTFRKLIEGNGEVVEIKHKGTVPSCDAVVIPGGESTTLCRLMEREGIADEIRQFAKEGKPVLGTCAGMILLAKCGDDQVAKTNQKLLGLMDITVNRNAFGRQRDSFEIPLEIKGMDSPFQAIFIRAPGIMDCGGGVEILARYDGFIVAARQDNLLALAFHPELTDDMRLHRYFIEMIKTLQVP